jgi:predicted permease
MSLRTSNHPATLLEHALRDLRYACRSFLRTPLVALTVVVTVGLGLGLVAVVFTILNGFVFQADEVRNPYELFAVQRQAPGDAESQGFTRLEYDAFVAETTLFAATFAIGTSDVQAFVDGAQKEGSLVTGNFFQALGVGAARGRALTPADDEPGAPAVIVLSHRAWAQQFASDPGIVGRTLRVNGTPFDVIGVMPDGFRGLRPIAAPDFWATVSQLGQFRPGNAAEESFGLDIVGRLRADLPADQALAQLRTWDSLRQTERSVDRPALTLEPRPGTIPLSAGVVLLFTPLFFAFGLILMIGCANVANLLLARGIARQREIGIRLAIGASRRRIVWQLLVESLLLALVAAAVGFGVSRFALASVSYAVTSTFPPEIGDLRIEVPPVDWRIAAFLVAGAVVSTLFFALAPALKVTRLEVVRTIQGVSAGRPARARTALITLQVTASVLLLICAAIFLRSTWLSTKIEPGIRVDDIVTVAIRDEQRRGTILDAVGTEASVASVAASWPGVPGRFPAFADVGAGRSAATFQFVSPEYFETLGIDILRGRGFTPTERGANETVAIVSESTAAELWPGADALGQSVRLESDPENGSAERGIPPPLTRNFVVVGVARDVAGFRMGGLRLAGAGIYVPISAEAAVTSLTLRVRGDAERARFALVDRLATIDPNMAQVSTLQTFARAEAYILGIPFWLTLVLGGLALLLTLSGLFSVLSYVVQQRMREFGVRSALGATRGRIGALVLAQSARPVGIGLVLGAGLTAALGGVLLATPAAEGIGTVVRVFDPLAYVVSLLGVVAACAGAALLPALRAGSADPVAALRQD